MFRRFSILIVNADKVVCDSVKWDLQKMGHVVFSAYNAQDFIKTWNVFQPDIVVFDVAVVEGVGNFGNSGKTRFGKKKKPILIAYSENLLPNMQSRINDVGADYYFFQEFSSKTIMAFICNIANEYSEREEEENSKECTELECEIMYVLHNMGVSSNLKGFNYLKMAVIQALEDSENMNLMTKVLYPKIAKKYNTTPAAVERAIRHSAEKAFKDGIPEVFQNIGFEKRKASNLEFISLITSVIKMQHTANTMDQKLGFGMF